VYKAGTQPFEPRSQPFLLVILETRVLLFVQAGLDQDPPILGFP
jgi:hypothetical protein